MYTHHRLYVMLCFLSCILCACANTDNFSPTPNNYLIELDQDYDEKEPFVNSLIFEAAEAIDDMELSGQLQMDCEMGTLEVINRSSGAILWSKTWDQKTVSSFTIPLHQLKKADEYTIQFTATGVKQATIKLQSEEPHFIERAKPKTK